MLDVALKFLQDQLAEHLRTRTGSDAVKVKMCRLVDDTGKVAFPTDGLGTLAMSVINIEEERVFKAQTPGISYRNGVQVETEPELKLNLLLLFAANFVQYEVALQYLSHLLLFFQANPAFTPERHPSLDARLGKLVMELQSLSLDQVNQIWAFVGGKQLPSVAYKLRLVVLQPETPARVQPPITSVAANVGNWTA